jgi:hypothetical protein
MTDTADSCHGREFQKPAHVQRAIQELLADSPMPWTTGMLLEWFGDRTSKSVLTWCLTQALSFRRVARPVRGVYCCPCKDDTSSIPQVVTDEMLERYGYNL